MGHQIGFAPGMHCGTSNSCKSNRGECRLDTEEGSYLEAYTHFGRIDSAVPQTDSYHIVVAVAAGYLVVVVVAAAVSSNCWWWCFAASVVACAVDEEGSLSLIVDGLQEAGVVVVATGVIAADLVAEVD